MVAPVQRVGRRKGDPEKGTEMPPLFRMRPIPTQGPAGEERLALASGSGPSFLSEDNAQPPSQFQDLDVAAGTTEETRLFSQSWFISTRLLCRACLVFKLWGARVVVQAGGGGGVECAKGKFTERPLF